MDIRSKITLHLFTIKTYIGFLRRFGDPLEHNFCPEMQKVSLPARYIVFILGRSSCEIRSSARARFWATWPIIWRAFGPRWHQRAWPWRYAGNVWARTTPRRNSCARTWNPSAYELLDELLHHHNLAADSARLDDPVVLHPRKGIDQAEIRRLRPRE